jgi:transcriptional regulator with XRE-family HTH domain
VYVDYIKERAKAKKLTVKDLAIMTNTSESTISNYFSRKTESPSFDVVSKLCIALDISIDEMVGIKQPDEKKEEINYKEIIASVTASYNERNEANKEIIAELKEDKKNSNKEKLYLYGIIVASLVLEFILGLFA